MDDATLALAFALAFALVVAWALLERRGRLRARDRAAQLDTQKRSASTRYGQLSEQFAPFMARFPLPDPSRFRFLGSPIDGVHFGDDAVYLVEIKSADSALSPAQKRIRQQIVEGRIGMVVFHINEDREPEIIRPWLLAKSAGRAPR